MRRPGRGTFRSSGVHRRYWSSAARVARRSSPSADQMDVDCGTSPGAVVPGTGGSADRMAGRLGEPAPRLRRAWSSGFHDLQPGGLAHACDLAVVHAFGEGRRALEHARVGGSYFVDVGCRILRGVPVEDYAVVAPVDILRASSWIPVPAGDRAWARRRRAEDPPRLSGSRVRDSWF